MIKLYSLSAFRPELKGLIRDIRAAWTLEELGIPFERKVMDPKVREHRQAPYLGINPFGKVPAIEDGDFKLYESFAVCTYLADKVGKLIPKEGTKERALYNQWCSFAVSTLEPIAARVVNFDFFTAKDATTEKLRAESLEIVNGFFATLDKELGTRPYLLGESFSVADIILSSVARYVGHTEVTQKYSNLQKYLEKNYARPAFKKALALHEV